MPTFLFAGAIGAAIAYFFDPQNGRSRRKESIKRAGALFRSTSRSAGQMASQAQGAAQGVKHRSEEPKEEFDDVTLARKVETEIFRDAEVPKGQINVNVEDGVVFLRGEVERDLIEDLAQKTRSVQGVLGVENLLHAPGEPAPAKPE